MSIRKVSFLVLNRLINLGIAIDPGQPAWVYSLNTVAAFLSQFVLPLFLFANFAILLDGKKPFKEQLLKFGSVLLAVIVGIEGLHQGILMNIPTLLKMIEGTGLFG